MKKYKSKVVEIEATQLINNEFRSLDDIPLSDCKNWIVGNDEEGFFVGIPTLEGVMKARNNDYIIKEPFPINDRMYYPCKPDIFEQRYEKLQKEITQEFIK